MSSCWVSVGPRPKMARDNVVSRDPACRAQRPTHTRTRGNVAFLGAGDCYVTSSITARLVRVGVRAYLHTRCTIEMKSLRGGYVEMLQI